MSDRHPPATNLDRYLDGLMSDEEAAAFRERHAADPTVQAEIDLQGSIDAVLGKLTQTDPEHLDACLRAGLDEDDEPMSIVRRRQGPTRPWWINTAALAAVVVLAGVAAWVWFGEPSTPPGSTYRTPQTVVVAEVYDLALAGGFEPDWVCETDQEFRDTFQAHLGQALSLRDLPDDRVALGLSYLARAYTQSVYLLAEAQGQPVLVFFDRESMLRHYELHPPAGLHLHRGRVGRLVVLELSPLEEAAFLDYIEAVEDAMDN